MSGITDLKVLLQSINPELAATDVVFCTVSGNLTEYCQLKPIATFVEKEGLTLILKKTMAQKAGLSFDGLFRQITLRVHSSLQAVGLTAAITRRLASKGISANVVAAYYHDHIFVQADEAQAALAALQELSS